jgi:hypothetical protein
MPEGRTVPRYYFHFSDGKRQFTDSSGVELSGMAAARANAGQQVRELKAAMCHPNVQDLSAWSMTMLDARKQLVFEIGFETRAVRKKA